MYYGQDLNLKQRRFCEYYALHFNGTKAAIEAGYSKAAAGQQSSTLLKNPKVREYLDHLTRKASKKIEITREAVLQEMAALAFSDIRDIFNDDGNLKQPHEYDDKAAKAVQSIDVTTLNGDEGQILVATNKIRLADKTKNLELLGKHLGLFTEKVELTKKVTIKDYTGESQADSE